MARGRPAKDGDTYTAQNEYHYTRVGGKWRLTHHLIAEQKLGRPIDTATEMVRFKDADRKNFSPDNIEVIPRRNNYKAQLATVEDKIRELIAHRERLLEKIRREELAKQNGVSK